MKRILSLTLVAVLVAVMLPNLTSCEQQETLNIFNWGQYIANGEDDYMDVIAEFEKRTGIHVNYTTYESNEAMYAKLKSGGASYDIIIPSDYMVSRLISEKMLEKIDYSKLTNYGNVDDSFKSMYYDPNNEYTVPYTWGTVGIIYNKKYVSDVKGWSSLWNEEYKGKILMFSNSRDAMAIGASLAGVDPNSTLKGDWALAAQKLTDQHDLVQEYVMDQIFDKMINETAWIAPYYAGDYLSMHEENGNLGFCFPEEGYNRFVDSMCIPKGATNIDAAHKFIDFILDEEIQFANLDYIMYSSPFRADLIPAAYKNDVSYPSDSTLSRSFIFEHLPTETLQYIDSLWTNVRIS